MKPGKKFERFVYEGRIALFLIRRIVMNVKSKTHQNVMDKSKEVYELTEEISIKSELVSTLWVSMRQYGNVDSERIRNANFNFMREVIRELVIKVMRLDRMFNPSEIEDSKYDEQGN